jgi:hypothetical protein
MKGYDDEHLFNAIYMNNNEIERRMKYCDNLRSNSYIVSN